MPTRTNSCACGNYHEPDTRKEASFINQDYNSDRPMFDAVCAECGADTQVPFQPSADRPVYCRDCFRKRRDSRGGSGRKMYDATCATCGAPTQVPFEPAAGRPVYCREHYQRS